MPRVLSALTDPTFLALAARRSDVLSRDELRAFGIRRSHVTRRLEAHLWQEVGDHVVVLHGGPLSRTQQLWAGVLHAGPGAHLAGLSSLEVDGLTGFSSPEVITLAPHGRGRRDLATEAVTIRVHESRHLPAEHLRDSTCPPRLRAERATILAASTAASDRACRTILAMTVQQQLTAPVLLRPLVAAQPTLRRRALILETLDDVEGGSESLPELEYLDGLRRFGLPLPTRQLRVRVAGGRYLLDCAFDQWLVLVEINGAHHLSPQQKESDDIRRTRLAIGGRLVADIGSYTVRHDIVLAVLLTADALLSRGWVPDPVVRQRLDRAAAAHPTFTWTTPTNGGAGAR